MSRETLLWKMSSIFGQDTNDSWQSEEYNQQKTVNLTQKDHESLFLWLKKQEKYTKT